MLGTTPGEIHAKFPGVIWQNLSTHQAPQRLRHLSDRELNQLAGVYANANHGDPYELLGVIRVYAPHQAARYQRAADLVYQQTRPRAPPPLPPDVVPPHPLVPSPPAAPPRLFLPPIRPLFHGRMTQVAYRWEVREKIAGAPVPTLDMTIGEIYLEFRTAAVGSLSVEAALYETATFVGFNLSSAAGYGYAAGTIASKLLQTYAPDTMDALVGQNLMLLIDGSSAFVPDQWTATLLVQDGSGYGLGDFGVANDLYLGPPLPWETPTPLPADPMSGWGFGPNEGFGFDSWSTFGPGRGSCTGKRGHARKC